MNKTAEVEVSPLRESTRQRYDQMAKAASVGLMAHHHVDSAIVEISGEAPDLALRMRCNLAVGIDPSTVMDVVVHGVISNIERMLGETFAERELRFSMGTNL